METSFRIKRVDRTDGDCVRGYWIESTAPVNVEDTQLDEGVVCPPGAETPLRLTEIPDVRDAVREIADYLKDKAAPEIAVTVHGFNNPICVVLRRFQKAFLFVNDDPLIGRRDDLVCIGYKWPSEAMGRPIRSFLSAAPGFVFGLAGIALLLLLASALFTFVVREPGWLTVPLRSLSYVLGLIVAAIPFAVFLLRAVVYFRDSYRATQYGIPDLVEVIRQLDRALAPEGQALTRRVRLSFIGHSMGAYVVTSLVRILSDVFSPEAAPNAVGTAPDRAPSNLGHAFTLGRLVLVSPDIPAETLMTRRANFLASSLRRFEEAYLFSSEGDVVLRLISTVANSFSFPTRHRKYGFRLGNTEVIDPDNPSAAPVYGVVNLDALQTAGQTWNRLRFLRALRVGSENLFDLGGEIQNETATRAEGETSPLPSLIPLRFTYFDCTDYIDTDPRTGRARAYLTRAKGRMKLAWYHHWSLLLAYLRGTVDVHSGYFDGPYTQALIYRLVCLGFQGVLETERREGHAGEGIDPLTAFSEACAAKRIQVLLSPHRAARPAGGTIKS